MVKTDKRINWFVVVYYYSSLLSTFPIMYIYPAFGTLSKNGFLTVLLTGPCLVANSDVVGLGSSSTRCSKRKLRKRSSFLIYWVCDLKAFAGSSFSRTVNFL